MAKDTKKVEASVADAQRMVSGASAGETPKTEPKNGFELFDEAIPAPPGVECPSEDKPAKRECGAGIIGSSVWFFLAEPSGNLITKPAILVQRGYVKQDLWTVTIIEAGRVWAAMDVEYCGHEHRNGCWCWPGE